MSGQLDPIQLMRKIDELENKIDAMRTIEIGGVWQSWTPTCSAVGSMTWTNIVIEMAKYCVIGKTAMGSVRIKGTTGGTASNALLITPPVTSNFINNSVIGSCQTDQYAFLQGHLMMTNLGTLMYARMDYGANFTIGTDIYVIGSFVYEIA